MYNNEESVIIFQQKLDVLRKNDQNLSINEIKTRYAKAYKKLQDEIAFLMVEAVHVLNVMGWEFFEKDREEAVNILTKAHAEINSRCFTEERKAELLKLAFSSYSSDLVFRQAELYLDSFEVDVYFPYWKKYCIDKEYTWLQDTKCHVYNPLNDAYWNASCNLWVNISEDGSPYWRFSGLSPVREDNIKLNETMHDVVRKKIKEFWEEYYKAQGKIVSFDIQEQNEKGGIENVSGIQVQ